MHARYSLSLLAFTLLGNAPVYGEACPHSAKQAAPIKELIDDAHVSASANALSGDFDGTIVFSGDVLFQQQGQTLQADRASYQKPSGDITLEGNIVIQDAFSTIKASNASLNQITQQAHFEDAEYQLNATQAQGSANTIHVEGEDKIVLNEASYTTCPPAAPRPWEIRSNNITLNQDSGFGSAKHIRLNIADIPVFYWPYLTFPINDNRKSGLLFPETGSTSDNGFEYSQPIYWNIHPQADATFTPRYLARRGTQLNAETRYLNRVSQWQVDGAFLDDTSLNEERWLVGTQQTGQWGDHWRSRIVTRRVSDTAYLDDLDSNLSIGRPQHLQSIGELFYTDNHWRHVLGIEQHQTLDTAIADQDTPHRRAPFFQSTASYQHQQWRFHWDSEWVNFTHKNNVQGERLDLYPSIEYNISQSLGWYATPKVGYRFTQYQLDQLNLGTTTDDAPDRGTGIASIDSGLYLERLTGDLVHTLEPRLYALYVQSDEQSQLPLFDSEQYTFSYDSLFRENRFTGRDRQGDAQQITLGLSSALINPQSGLEHIRASIGQTFYFADRDISLSEAETSPTPDQTESQSDIATDIKVAFSQQWRLQHQGQFDPNTNDIVRSINRVQYLKPGKALFNVGHYYQQNDADQWDISGVWRLSAAWQAHGRWLWDSENTQSLETFAGFTYQSCCWGVSVTARRQRENNNVDNEFFVQFHLKGLASLGSDNDSLLSQSIASYTSYE